MTVLRDEGVYRHIKFKNPDDSNHWFEIVTWPNHLTISGDMGCYTFSRLEDMFNFFSTKDDKLNINVGYWTEKLVSVSRFGGGDGIKIFSAKDTLKNIIRSGLIKDVPVEERREFKEDLLSCETAEDAAYVMREYSIDDYWEYFTEKPTGYILWNLFAIRWGIMKYKKYKQGK